ncbi:MAG: manganese efflux pump [Planctomycetes bacterium]|nr:manganese efflux pump [Planctomycetota bacterium]
MNLLAVTLLACGLAVDSCLVSLAQGLSARVHTAGRAFALAAVFGGFQGAMLVGGWFAGEPVARWFAHVDHWIAFGVLALIGVRTIREGYANGDEPREPFGAGRLVLAGVATSIDALAAGFGLALADAPITAAALLTTTITAAGCALAYTSGRGLGRRWERGAHWVAGLVLIAIGARILLEHLGGSGAA